MRPWDKRIAFLFLTMILSALALLASCSSADTHTPTPACPTVLDEETLQQLTFTLTTLHPTIEMPPGGVYTFTLGVVECCYVFEPVQACAAWSVEPSEGVSIDPDSGLFMVDEETPSASVFTVSADVENGRRVVSMDMHISTPESNPLARLWREEAQLACDDGEEVVPQVLIQELRFRADGTFGVTWHPFEVYVDYSGAYTYNLENGTLDLVISSGNYIPDDVDGSGSFSVDEQGRLVLRDMWLGSPQTETGEIHCGHRFE